MKELYLKNGVTVMLAPYENSETFTFGISFNVGGRNEWQLPEEYDGISHFLEHQIFKGNERLKPLEINKKLDEFGMSNAFTTEDTTCYYAKTSKENAHELVSFFYELLDFGEISEDEFKKESFVVLQEFKRMEDNPDFLLYTKVKEVLNRGTSLEMSVIGNEKSLSTVTTKQMEEYRKEHYNLSNAAIMVIGNFDEQEVVEVLEGTFGSLKLEKRREGYELAHFQRPSEEMLHIFKIRKELPLTFFTVAMKLPGAREEIIWPLMIINYALSLGKSALLDQWLVKTGLCSYAYSSLEEHEDISNLILGGACDGKNLTESLNTLISLLKKFVETPLSENELGVLLDKVEHRMSMALEEPLNLMNAQASALWHYGKFTDFNEFLSKLRGISSSDVKQAAEVIFGKINAVIGIMGSELPELDLAIKSESIS